MKDKKRPKCVLVDRTVELLKTCGKSVAVVAKETGLPYGWLSAMRYRDDFDPAASRTIQLYEYLTGKQLEIN